MQQLIILPDQNLSSAKFHDGIEGLKGNQSSDKPRKRRFAGPFGSLQLALLEIRRHSAATRLRRRRDSDSWGCITFVSARMVVDGSGGPSIPIVEL